MRSAILIMASASLITKSASFLLVLPDERKIVRNPVEIHPPFPDSA
jgi:hypothetical protein